MVKVSVIITTFNSERSIKDVVNSIKSQKGQSKIFDLEIIAVDDCSTDNSLRILNNLGITVLSNITNSGGPNKGRNLAMKIASGDYICFCDHDDIWYEEKLMKLLSVKDFAPIISSGYTLVDNLNQRKIDRVNFTNSEKEYIFYPKNSSFLSKLSKHNHKQNLYLGSLMINKKLKKIKFEEKYGMVDYDWILKILHENSSVEICASLYQRIVKRNNLSLNINYRKNDFKITYNIMNYYKSTFSRQAKIGIKNLNGSYARFFYLIGDMRNARKYFFKSNINFKTFLYIITTFIGSKFVKKRFNVFG